MKRPIFDQISDLVLLISASALLGLEFGPAVGFAVLFLTFIFVRRD